MPRHIELKKDASNGETRRGVVRAQRSVGIRMEESGISRDMSSMAEYIGHERATRGTETSKYPEEKKETSISKVAASEMERAQTSVRACWGSDCEKAGVR